MSSRHAVIVGAGLAGLAAAVELVEAGHRVTVLEQASVVGGRTSSRDDHGMAVESGVHRYLGFYIELSRLIQRVGLELDEVVTWQDEIEVISPNGGPGGVFPVSTIPRPTEMAASLLGDPDFLSTGQELALASMMAAGIEEYRAGPEQLDAMSVAGFARVHGVADETIFRLLGPLTEGLSSVPSDEYSAFAFFGLVAPCGTSPAIARVGAFRGGMTDVLAEPIARHVRAKGAEVHTRVPVERVLFEEGRVVGVVAGGEQRRADVVIIATSHGPAQALVGEALGRHDPRFARLLALKTTVSVSLQLDLDEPCLPVDRATFSPGTLLASFSEQSRSTFADRPGRLSVLLARPENLVDIPAQRLTQRVTADAHGLGIELEGLIRDCRKVVIPTDHFSLRRGSELLRPPQRTGVPGLLLAGDYTAEEFPATMEGAVLSGIRAAEAAREQLE